ncbi:pyridoxal phosphate-dependent aminotransferase [Acidomonas methanolica]|uniref:pyridoxal phosphate-dependent aminotransferase n=1 Tax=Acidomonas methanolica TaxID=437 RepID=UPI00211A4C1E|nr:histidinol-phosphate transaminase [Acidomonas methanolica]MCQ9154351.1 histidinol-phosphate transaminase [Acidomonas methanolica]
MSRLWNRRVAALEPYVPGEQPTARDLLKLNTNELPYGPSPRALAALRESCTDTLRLYPDPTSLALRETIGHAYDVTPDRVFVGNGSDEVLAHAFRGLFRDDAPALFADVTYGFYPVYCGLFDQPFETVPLGEDFRIDVRAYDRPCGGIAIANPNANTGIALPVAELAWLARARPDSTLIVDEAYVDFGADSAIRLTRDHDNVLVVQTLSKSRALAGLRVGYAIGHPDLIEGLTRVKDSFNSYPLDRLAQIGAAAAIADSAWLAETTGRVIATREALVRALAQRGFQVLPSCANFILMRHATHSAASLQLRLRERDIIVRRLGMPRIADWLRLTIGTDRDSDRLLAALDDIRVN